MVKAFLTLFLAFWFLTPVTLSGSPDVDELTTLKATLYTKILFLDYDVKKKLIDDKVVFVVVYDTPQAKKKARSFAEAASHRRVMGHEVVVESVDVGSKSIPEATAYVLFLSDRHLPKAVDRLIAKRRLIFVNSPEYLKYGMITLDVGTRVVPVINPLFIKRAGIELRPIIFKVAKVWHDQIQ